MAEAEIEYRDSPHYTDIVSFTASCGMCDYVEFGAMNRKRLRPTASEVLADHLKQHEPGRALDIEVDWEPSGICPVCDDGIGMIGWDEDGEGVKCKDCGTTWDLDGTNGERSD